MDDVVSELEQLRAENKRLRQLNRLYRETIAFTGHQWRDQISLLNFSVLTLEKDAQQTLDGQQKQALQRIQHSAATILRVARYYMHLPHIQYREFHPNRVFVGPAEDIFKPLLFGYADLLATRRQTAELLVSHPDLLIWADRELLITACQNLLQLAIELGATDSNITLHVLERGNVDEFCIWNRGTPISEQSLGLFNSSLDFIAIDECLSHEQIGLYLACLIIEAHKGTLFVEANMTMGIKFVFTLPKRHTLLKRKLNRKEA